MGFNNVAGFLILGLAVILSICEWRYQRNQALGTRLSEIYHSRSLHDLFRPIRWLDYPLFLQHQSVYWGATKTLRHLETHPDILPKKVTRIVGFKLLGENKRGKPLLVKDSFVQSLVTGKKISTQIDGIPVSQVKEIPAYHVFAVTAEFKIEEELPDEGITGGVPVGVFRRRFAPFQFVFEVEGSRHSEEFTLEEVDLYLYRLIKSDWGAGGERAQILPSES